MKRITAIIYEGVLNDDYIIKNRKNYTLTYYTYRNHWANNENQIKGPDLDKVLEAYDKATGRLKSKQPYLSGSDIEEEILTTEELAREIDYMEI